MTSNVVFDLIRDFANAKLAKINADKQRLQSRKMFDEIIRETMINGSLSYESVIHNNYFKIIELLPNDEEKARFEKCVDTLKVFEKVGILNQSFPQLEEVTSQIKSIFKELKLEYETELQEELDDENYYDELLGCLNDLQNNGKLPNLTVFKRAIDELEMPLEEKNEIIVALINFRLDYEKARVSTTEKTQEEENVPVVMPVSDALKEKITKCETIFNALGLKPEELKRTNLAYAGISGADFEYFDDQLKKEIIVSKIYSLYELLESQPNYNEEEMADITNELDVLINKYEALDASKKDKTETKDKISYHDSDYLDNFIFLTDDDGNRFYDLSIARSQNPKMTAAKADEVLKELSLGLNNAFVKLLGVPIRAHIYRKMLKGGQVLGVITIPMGNSKRMIVLTAGDNVDKTIDYASRIIDDNLDKISAIMKDNAEIEKNKGGASI